jgi:nucleotide-binding universal stress UspA family protein
VPAQENPAGPRVVAGIDGSESSASALRWAIRQAGLTGAAVDAATAWHYPDLAASGMPAGAIEPACGFFLDSAEKIAADAIRSTLDPASDVPVRTRIAQGHAAQVLLDASAGASLLVGSHGHGGFAEALLGSLSQH